ncbi:AraC-like DNA-binding protein [Paraburkholderia sp. JPY419]
MHCDPRRENIRHRASCAGLSDSRLAGAIREMHEHPTKPWTVAALAKNLLRRIHGRIAEIAQRGGYSSTITFSVAFTWHVGRSPMRYAREAQTIRDGG